jgi:hypothetical protein
MVSAALQGRPCLKTILRSFETGFEDFLPRSAPVCGCSKPEEPEAEPMPMRTTRITVEQDTITVIRRESVERSWCPVCAAEVDAVVVGGPCLTGILGEGTAHGWIAGGQLHASQQPGGTARICLPSLLQCFESQQTPATHIKEKL